MSDQGESSGGGSSPLARGTRATRRRPRDATSVHPRSRGEHWSAPGAEAAWAGSSPLARGTLRGHARPRSHPRFIPARAGNTLRRLRGPEPPPVHPRSRGEHRQIGWSTGVVPGSSPLARGTRAPRPTGRARSRFIPARAGNTLRPALGPRRAAVHPRSRGEHDAPAGRADRPAGSSPLARGTLSDALTIQQVRRFIPARAGNTHPPATHPGDPAVHPRSRGEHGSNQARPPVSFGSSPLARGTLRRRLPGVGRGRFIPARAGNTWAARPATTSTAVHPRSRGEHAGSWSGTPRRTGSSPLARGTRGPAGGPGGADRFIPARAGNTHPGRDLQVPVAVHPRSRGEHDRNSNV